VNLRPSHASIALSFLQPREGVIRGPLVFLLVGCLGLGLSPLVQAHPFGLAVSASQSDPYVNVVEAANGPVTYYLWFACEQIGWCNLGSAEFALITTGEMEIVSTDWLNNCLPIWNPPNIYLACGCCPGAPSPAGMLHVIDKGGSICFAPSTNGILGVVGGFPYPECINEANYWDADWIGLNTAGGAAPCSLQPLCGGAVSVDESSWGRVKGMYR
jgi:hypothetical protein